MRVLRYKDTYENRNSDLCIVTEYDFKDKDIDFSVGEINGRYPDSGFCVNREVKEMVYVLEGGGCICFEDKTIPFEKGDALLIEKGEKYYWDAHCKVAMACTPAWYPSQHQLVD